MGYRIMDDTLCLPPNRRTPPITHDGYCTIPDRQRRGETFLLCVVHGASYGGKAAGASNDYIVIAAGAVDDQQLSVCVPAANDAHMGIIRVEHQVTGLGLIPRDGGTVGVLHVGTAAVAYDVLSIRDIVKYPIDK